MSFSHRYGDLWKIWRKTGGRCHLCLEKVDLTHYGAPGMFGIGTVTVDHVLPQAFGGDDHHDNLRLAHASCNSMRGTQEVEEVRLALTGEFDEPPSTAERNLAALAVGIGGYGVAGTLLATPKPDGAKEFNHRAGVAAGLLVAHEA